MPHSIIGWEKETPIPEDYRFNEYLSVKQGELYLGKLNLHRLFAEEGYPGLDKSMPSPLELIYLPIIRDKIKRLQGSFEQVAKGLNYTGKFHYTYASKANAAEEVVRTILSTSANYELSSWVDVAIAEMMLERGILTSDKMVICNGFKQPGSEYMAAIIAFQQKHGNVIPVIEDIQELEPLIESGVQFEVGLRLKTYGQHASRTEMERANSRFGLNIADIHQAAQRIKQAPNLTLKLLHTMTGSQIENESEFINRLRPGLGVFVELKEEYPELNILNFGGGVPVPMSLDFQFDYDLFARLLLSTIQEMCNEANVSIPDVMGEMGRYTVSEHGAHLFKVQAVKENGSNTPWYIIDGSIMSSFPDIWALGDHFVLLPLNHLDKPFQQVQIGGITCDSDDIYPQKKSKSPLFLPVETDELYVGFFNVGAYQEMLGGAGGSKHCVIPEAQELIIDFDENKKLIFEEIAGQDTAQVLLNLGYK